MGYSWMYGEFNFRNDRSRAKVPITYDFSQKQPSGVASSHQMSCEGNQVERKLYNKFECSRIVITSQPLRTNKKARRFTKVRNSAHCKTYLPKQPKHPKHLSPIVHDPTCGGFISIWLDMPSQFNITITTIIVNALRW